MKKEIGSITFWRPTASHICWLLIICTGTTVYVLLFPYFLESPILAINKAMIRSHTPALHPPKPVLIIKALRPVFATPIWKKLGYQMTRYFPSMTLLLPSINAEMHHVCRKLIPES